MKGQGEAVRAALRHLAGACVAALVLFHAWLVARRLSDPASLEPRIAIRWLVGFAVVGALLWLRRRGLPLLGSRKALAVWALALLIHGNAGATPLPAQADAHSGPEALVLVLPAALSVATASALLLLAAARQQGALASLGHDGIVQPAPRARLLSPCLAGHAPRGPPTFS